MRSRYLPILFAVLASDISAAVQTPPVACLPDDAVRCRPDLHAVHPNVAEWDRDFNTVVSSYRRGIL